MGVGTETVGLGEGVSEKGSSRHGLWRATLKLGAVGTV